MNNIYFTGFMGSGKSTLAPLVANVLGYGYADVDQEIEKRIGQTIAEFFKEQGETKFREIEQTVLTELSERDSTVIALGGGTVSFGENLHIAKSTGTVVYLKADIETILRRVKRKRTRPMLFDENGVMLSDAALLERIERLFSLREPFYLQADITVPIGDANVAFTVDRIVNMIRRYKEPAQ